jgi:hypothetical protein
MKISELKKHLLEQVEINFSLENGTVIAKHFHITEMGVNTKHFIDCGNVIHTKKTASFQIWVADDTDHRLSVSGFLKIIDASEALFCGEDLDIQVEFQADTIGIYGLVLQNNTFVLTNQSTDCLAKEHCGVPPAKSHLLMTDIPETVVGCTPGGGCC